ncbi:hypothetical protein [Rhodococcus ruber]|uniref:hypothetical protein n=1 Tax=Rhodococcus ruber TaxID=1830 RepID=UPI003784B008
MFPAADIGIAEFPTLDAALEVFPGSVLDVAEFPPTPILAIIVIVEVIGEGVPGAVVGAVPFYPVAVIGSGTAGGTASPVARATVTVSGSGLAKLVYGEIIAVDVTGSGSAAATVVPVVSPVVAVSGSGTGAATIVPVVNPAGGASASGTASATVVPVGVGTITASGSGAAGATVVGVNSFTPTGMTKSGSQTFVNSEIQVSGFSADTSSFPGSVVQSGTTLVVQGGKADATVAASAVGDGSSSSRQFWASLRLNGAEVASAQGSNTSTLSLAATVDVVDGDLITLHVVRTSGSGNASIGSGTWVRCM